MSELADLTEFIPESKQKESLAKMLLQRGVSTSNIIVAIRGRFGSGMGTSKIGKLRREIKTESNIDLDSARSKNDLELISKNRSLFLMVKENRKLIKQFFGLFMSLNKHLQEGDINSTIFIDEVERHIEEELMNKYVGLIE